MNFDNNGEKSQPSVTFVPFLRWTGIAMLTLGWGSLLFLASLAPAIPGWIGDQLRSTVTLVKNQFRWTPPTLLVIGLTGTCLLLATSSRLQKLRPIRAYLIALGLGTTSGIVALCLAVDSQPPGSALAMLISLFGFFLFPMAIVGLIVGIFGLILLIWTSPEKVYSDTLGQVG